MEIKYKKNDLWRTNTEDAKGKTFLGSLTILEIALFSDVLAYKYIEFPPWSFKINTEMKRFTSNQDTHGEITPNFYVKCFNGTEVKTLEGTFTKLLKWSSKLLKMSSNSSLKEES